MRGAWSILLLVILQSNTHGQIFENGEINGAPFQIVIPENWNRGLVMYAHGYEETDEYRNQEAEEEDLADDQDEDIEEESEFYQIFTTRGYAVAFSEFRKKGLVIKEGMEDTEAVRVYFEAKYGKPEWCIVTGHSMGGMISIATIEKYQNEYQGAMPLCGWVGPVSLLIKRTLDMLVTFDYFFAGNTGELVVGQHLVSYEDIGSMLVDNDHLALLFCERFSIKADDLAAVIYFFQVTFKETAKNRGGLPIGNLQTIYNGFGFQNDKINRNIRRYEANPDVEEHFLNYYTTTGKISDPVMALHTTYDELIPASNYGIYEQLINHQKSSSQYQVRYVVRDGHCNFTDEEVGDTFDHLIDWIKSGRKPKLEYE